ncbi:methyl-accepting chemotaxis protein [Nitrincola iocasae]|jgi:methyl-accepting chemotaxis protein|uniref:HAMP domain-containing protein n=1 Tax=Nitrincola iocasae TaxID=2614693 RepID=A0A5J6LD14_9GAMM|nr:methyl-accepting chemotaxis protein [Nitrincola iocasae]QEW06122.1 HAMP domain-containing protein [Nitrincola iocasae]
MTIKAKISAGFAAVALISLLLGSLGYWGAVRSEASIAELGERRLPAVQTVLEMQVALNNVVTGFRTLMDQSADTAARNRQYQVIADSREVYRALVNRYDALPKSAEEERAWQVFQTTLPDWLAANNEIAVLHQELDELRIANPQAFVGDLQDRIAEATMGETLRYQEAAFTALDQVVRLNMNAAASQVEFGINQAALLKTISLLAMLIGVILSAGLGFIITRGITRPLTLMVNAVERVRDSGNFNEQVNYTQKDEIGQVIRAFNTLLSSQKHALEEANTTIEALASGDFNARIQGEYAGDLDALKTGINSSAETIRLTMDELSKVMQAIRQGEFGVSINPALVRGDYRLMLENAAHGMQSLKRSVDSVVQVMTQVAEGQFGARVDADASGEMLKLKNMINQSVSALETAFMEIQRVMQALAKGDLTEQVQGQYPGDLGTLADAANTTVVQLSDVIQQIHQSVGNVNTAATEISAGNTDLSQRTEEQASSLEETASSMEELTSTVKQNADNARQANQLAGQANRVAEAGGSKVQEAVATMHELTASSEKITNIISVIDGIAFQTNILALNAAVEAARAGEQGRGFAVVAGEVRTLAQRSAAAAKEIQSLIKEDAGIVENGSRLVREAGVSMDEIVQSVKRVTDIMAEISAASEEQSQGIEQINQAITQMDDVTQQNAALVEEAAAAAESLEDQAASLSQAVSVFKMNLSDRQAVRPPKLQANPVNKRPATIKHLPHAGTSEDEWEEF